MDTKLKNRILIWSAVYWIIFLIIFLNLYFDGFFDYDDVTEQQDFAEKVKNLSKKNNLYTFLTITIFFYFLLVVRIYIWYLWKEKKNNQKFIDKEIDSPMEPH